MPPKDSTLKFKNYQKSLRAAFVMYADFECLTTKIDTCQPDEKVSFTQKYQKHEPTSFSLYIKYKHGDYKPPITYRGPNATKVFYDMVRREALEIKKIYDHVYPIKMTAEDEVHFQRTDTCHICKWSINKYPSPYSNTDHVDFEKVRDHDHLMDPSKYVSNYRGPAHMLCNMMYQEPSFIPIFIHNLSGYDAHLFIKELGADNETIDIIPNTDEKYISFSKEVGSERVVVAGKNVKMPGIKLRFVDSFRFMASSLDSLAKNVKEFRETAKFFPKDKLDLVTRKGVYPYDYMDSWEKYEETRLPNKTEFYSKLNETDISDQDYKHAKAVWKAFNIKNLGEYSDLYVKTDVLILADVMEHFRNVCMETYKLDPAWYFSAPGLSWDAMLKTTKVRLELLDDYDMILMLEKGTRGGISQCCNRYGKANNKYMKGYDKSKESNYLMYLDANNLYGWAISQFLPFGGFRWGDNDIDVTKIPDDTVVGCIIECDLEYPEYLHNLHSDLSLAPENRIPDDSKQAKLLTTLHHKEHYVVHYRVLKLYLQMGLKLKKVHRVLEFYQSPWLKKYIDLNTEMRTKASNDFEKDFFKLMNNSVFGKTMENIRKRLDIRLCCDTKKVEKLIAKPNFRGRNIFSENLAAIHMNKTKVKFDKPIYVGMSILDLSKHLMYDFHYNVMKPKYGEHIKLLYMDTDSFIYDIKTYDFYADMKEMINYFDTSDYQENNRYGLQRVNKKVLGKMKDEHAGKIFEEFVGLRSKMYACKTEESLVKKSKGVKKCVVKNRITFEDYKDCLFSQKQQ
ncbi:uncharacterized protein TNCV_2826231 [Trichonephila clavipes]|nr:uncharacterized protein TNCV_2826231 [Trichonephila clavipes]